MTRSTLPARIADVLDEDRDANARARRLWRARAPRRRSRTWWSSWWSIAAPVAAALALAFLFAPSTPPSEAELAAPLPASSAETLPLALGPGRHALGPESWVELDPQGEATRVIDRPDELVFLLSRGRVELEIRPGGTRRVEIEAGLARVTVVGTHFTVQRASSSVRVEVTRGAVLVRGELVPERARVVRAGETLVVEAPAEASAVQAPTPPARIVSPSRAEALPGAVPLPSAVPPAAAVPLAPRVAAPTSTWREHADAREYHDAWQALGPGQISEQASEGSAQDLLALADVARRTGHHAAAVEVLTALLRRFPEDPDAAMGAFTLGRIQLDALGRPAEAAAAFERAIAGRLPGPLLPDAWARLALARRDAGERELADEAARRYLAHYPDGARAAEMRALLER